MAWLTGWSYRKSITISRSAGAVTDYQMLIKVGESAGSSGYDVNCAGHSLSTLNDLRFTTSDGTTLLKYWIDAGATIGTTPNQTFQVWVKFDSIGTGDTTFYMYYGKSDAAAYSSGADTFIFFDDFERGINGDAVGGSWATASSFTISTTHAFGGTRSGLEKGYGTITQAASDLIAIRFRMYKPNAGWQKLWWGNGTHLLDFQFENITNILDHYYSGSGWVTDGTLTQDAWNLIELSNFIWANTTCDVWLNGTKIVANANWHQDYAGSNGIITFGGNNSSMWLDDVIVRNFRATEPSWGSWGNEEVPSTHYTKTLGLDSYLQKIYTKTLSLDSYLKKNQIILSYLDAFLKKNGLTSVLSLDALIKKLSITELYYIDAILEKTKIVSSYLDADLKKIGLTKESSIDSFLQKTSITNSVNIDSLLSMLKLLNIGLDSYLSHLGLTRTISIDAFLHQIGLTRSSSIDAILIMVGLDTISSSIDSMLKKIGVTKLSSIDSFLKKIGVHSNVSIDGLLYKHVTKSVSIDAILRLAPSFSMFFDALLMSHKLCYIHLDAVLSTHGVIYPNELLAYLFGHKKQKHEPIQEGTSFLFPHKKQVIDSD
jgi:hypothetical protein